MAISGRGLCLTEDRPMIEIDVSGTVRDTICSISNS